ncbi:MAG: tetratricopeptide repeat protein [Acidobacteriota bacterium]
MELGKAGRYEEVIEVLGGLIEDYPNIPPAYNFLGSVYWKRGNLDGAIDCFQKAVKYAPSWELASRALFHALYERGQKDRAFAEVRRFLSIAESKEYLEILNDLNAGLFRSPSHYLKISDDPSRN